MRFEARDPALLRWLGDALNAGEHPENATHKQLRAIRRLFGLPATATDDEVDIEIAAWRAGLYRRDVQ